MFEINTQLHDGRLYVHESYPTGPSTTISFPVHEGGDGNNYVVFGDADEAELYAELLGTDDDLNRHCWDGWESNAIALADVRLERRWIKR